MNRLKDASLSIFLRFILPFQSSCCSWFTLYDFFQSYALYRWCQHNFISVASSPILPLNSCYPLIYIHPLYILKHAKLVCKTIDAILCANRRSFNIHMFHSSLSLSSLYLSLSLLLRKIVKLLVFWHFFGQSVRET